MSEVQDPLVSGAYWKAVCPACKKTLLISHTEPVHLYPDVKHGCKVFIPWTKEDTWGEYDWNAAREIRDDVVMTRDVDRSEEARLRMEVERLKAVMQIHHDQRGSNRCYLDDQKMYRDGLGIEPDPFVTALAPEQDHIEDCRRYWRQRQCPAVEGTFRLPGDMTIAELTEEAKRLRIVNATCYEEIVNLHGEIDQLRAEASRFYCADGTFETLAPGEVIERRKVAAKEIEKLKKENSLRRWAAEKASEILSDRAMRLTHLELEIERLKVESDGLKATITRLLEAWVDYCPPNAGKAEEWHAFIPRKTWSSGALEVEFRADFKSKDEAKFAIRKAAGISLGKWPTSDPTFHQLKAALARYIEESKHPEGDPDRKFRVILPKGNKYVGTREEAEAYQRKELGIS